jgi:hypothetical protein
MTYPPEYGPPRCTAYAYVYSRGLMAKYGTLEQLFEIGRRAASEARWRGIVPMQVWEGGGQQWFWVHTWSEDIWAGVIAAMEQEAKTAFADAASSQDVGWGEGCGPWDSDDIR